MCRELNSRPVIMLWYNTILRTLLSSRFWRRPVPEYAIAELTQFPISGSTKQAECHIVIFSTFPSVPATLPSRSCPSPVERCTGESPVSELAPVFRRRRAGGNGQHSTIYLNSGLPAAWPSLRRRTSCLLHERRLVMSISPSLLSLRPMMWPVAAACATYAKSVKTRCKAHPSCSPSSSTHLFPDSICCALEFCLYVYFLAVFLTLVRL